MSETKHASIFVWRCSSFWVTSTSENPQYQR